MCSTQEAIDACELVRPTEEELLNQARDITKDYFETLFSAFVTYLNNADGSTMAEKLVNVFPVCSQIAPGIAGDFSRATGYNIRRVTLQPRNARNRADAWEAKQLEDFATMAEQGKPRTLFQVTKPDGGTLNTKEYEATAFVQEEGVEYFRYMRSITMPPHPADPGPNPKLPCQLCHGTLDKLPPGLKEAIYAEYPYDMALGFKTGDIRGAWTIKIPIIEGKSPRH